MKKLALISLVLASTSFADGKTEIMAHSCAGCHGTFGRIENSAFMPLAGMPAEQFIRAMTEFREGERQSTLMGYVAQGFTLEDIEAMAHYFEQQPEERRP